MPKPSPDFSEMMSAPGSSPPLHVFVAYESNESRLQAWGLYRYLAENAGRGLDMRSAFYQLDALADQKDGAETIEAVAQADIVVLSINTNARLSPEIIYWIESWIPKQLAKSGGLLVLIENGGKPRSSRTPTENYMQGVAKRAGMEFLAQRVGVSSPPRWSKREASRFPARIAQPVCSSDGLQVHQDRVSAPTFPLANSGECGHIV